MSMAPLPVPPLDASLERFLRTVSAIAGPGAEAAARADVERFRRGGAQRLQRELERFAESEHEAGRSWLSEEWSREYLRVREPLPLASNVAYELELAIAAGDPGDEEWAAEAIHRIATVHLAEARGATSPEVDARGTALSMEQWPRLAGGIRHPRPVEDVFLPAGGASSRPEIGVLRHGRLFAMPVGDETGRALAIRTIAEQLRRTLALADEGGRGLRAPGFADAAYLGSDALAGPLEGMLSEPENARAYRRAAGLLFVVALTEESADAAERLRALLVEPGRALVRKPLSYQLDLRARRVHVHSEHSGIDGGTLVEAVRRMQRVHPRAEDDEAPAAPVELRWRWSSSARSALREALEAYRGRASRIRVELVRAPRIADERLPFRMSPDALQQFVMTIAQLRAFGRARSAYEAVDMRAFQSGRTECLRPVTPEAVAFGRALLDGGARPEGLRAALDAHREWVKACKTGHGFDRHFTGLSMIAARLGISEPFFACEALAAVRTDLLSTTSLGAAEQIVRYTFAPTTDHGFGIAYTRHPDAFEFSVSYFEPGSEQPARFLESLSEAARLLNGFIVGLSDSESKNPEMTTE